MEQQIVRIDLGAWVPDAGVFENPGLVAVRGWVPWSTGVYRPRGYFAFTAGMPNLGAQVAGLHYHTFGSVWEAYAVCDNSGAPRVWQVTLAAGSPPSSTGISSITDRTGSTWSGSSTFAAGYRMATYSKYVLLVGDDSTDHPQLRDTAGSGAFIDMIPSGSADRPRGRYIATAGNRVAMAYITHSSTAERDRVGSSDLTNPNLVWVSGIDDPTYWSTPDTTTGTNVWDEAKLSEWVQLIDDLGDITGLQISGEGYLFVAKERGIYRVDTTTQLDALIVSRDVGSRSPNSLVYADGYLYFYDTQGHFSRVNAAGQAVENLTAGSIASVLLSEDWLDLGEFDSGDPDNGGDPWKISPDVNTIVGSPGTYRYPVGAWDAHSRTVRWIYPSAISGRWAELSLNVDTLQWSGLDVTHAQDKPTGTRRVEKHWIATALGSGLRWAPSSSPRYIQAPRDVLYGFQTGASAYSLTYPWADQDYGYLLLDLPQIRTGFLAYGDGRSSRVKAIRLIYNRSLIAEENDVDIRVAVRIRTKNTANSTPVASLARTLDYGTSPPKDPDGWYNLPGKSGRFHQVEVLFLASAFDVSYPSSAAQVVNEFERFEVILEPTGPRLG